VNTKENKTNRRYDEDFKRSAVELVERGDRRMKQLAGELNVTVCSIRDWRKKYGRGSATDSDSLSSASLVSASENLAIEVARLRRELEIVSRQRDILKKACSILGQEPLKDLN
jgi:transposase